MKPTEDCSRCSASEEMRWSYLERGNAQASLLLHISNSSKGFLILKIQRIVRIFIMLRMKSRFLPFFSLIREKTMMVFSALFLSKDGLMLKMAL